MCQFGWDQNLIQGQVEDWKAVPGSQKTGGQRVRRQGGRKQHTFLLIEKEVTEGSGD